MCVCLQGVQADLTEAGPPTHHDDKVDSDQQVVNKELSLSRVAGDAGRPEGQRHLQLPWREAGPPNRHHDKVDSDQYVVNKELSLSGGRGCRPT